MAQERGVEPLLFYMEATVVEDRVYYGGQAVIEGVMMRGRKNMVTVVRRPDGNLAMDILRLAGVYTGRLRKAPLVRGIIVLLEALVLGTKTLLYSANVSLEEEEEQISGWSLWVVLLVALAFGVALFFVAPLFITKLINPYVNSALVFNLIEGCIRIVIFIVYIKLITLLPDLKRVFAYHGAEHKTVNAYEDGVPLEVAAARNYSTGHVRCGTSFLFAVLIISIIVFALVGLPSVWLMALSRILLIPVIAALAYEVTYFGGRHATNRLVRAILAPGLWLQSLTTREPDDSQLEVAISALRKVIELDQLEETV